jgi:hypothetical protein
MFKVSSLLIASTYVVLVNFFCLLPLALNAGELAGIQVNSVRLVSLSPTVATIHIEYSMEANQRLAMVVGLAYSDDKTKITQRGSSAPAVGPSQNSGVTITVQRPPEPFAHLTNKLLVKVMDVDSRVSAQRSFDLQIQWQPISDVEAQASSARYIFEAMSLNWISRNYFIEGQYSALDELLDRWNDPMVRDIDGQWKLSHFLEGIQQEFLDKKWKDNLRRLEGWKRQSPNSIALPLVEATYWLTYGSSVLGGSYEKLTDPFAVSLARERFGKAEKILLGVKQRAAKYPVWYELYISTSANLGRTGTQMRKIISEAVKRHPAYHPIYANMIHHLATQSETKIDWDAVDSLITMAADNTRDVDGGIAYATLYIETMRGRGRYINPFAQTRAIWSRLRNALEERARRFPSQSNINELVAYACVVGDEKVYLNTRPRLKYIVPEVWPNNHSPDLCDRRFLKSA